MPLSGATAAGTATAADGSSWTLDRLMSTLAQKKSGHASFVEKSILSIATKPIESRGELAFAAPDHLEKRTESPKPERLVVDGDMLTVERNDRKYTVALAHYPELEAFIEAFVRRSPAIARRSNESIKPRSRATATTGP